MWRRTKEALSLGWFRRPSIAPVQAPAFAVVKWHDVLEHALEKLQKNRYEFGTRSMVAKIEQEENICKLKKDIIVAEDVVSEDDFAERRTRWAKLLRAEKKAKDVASEFTPDDGKSPSKWTAEMLADYVPLFRTGFWEEHKSHRRDSTSDHVHMVQLKEFLLASAAQVDSCTAPSDGSDSDEALLAVKSRARTNINEILAVVRGDGESLASITSCNESVSRQFIDAVLLPLCHQAGLRLSLEAKLGGGALTATGYADYVVLKTSSRGGKKAASHIVALVEAKRLDPAWAGLLSQAIAQAIIQLIVLEGSCSEAHTGRLALVSDGRRWIAGYDISRLTGQALLV
jgi:hypothetical protein